MACSYTRAMQLDAVQARVIGSLVEKELTTPQQYPLTLNALVLACNQASNRDPVMALGEDAVRESLDSLRDARLVRFVLPSHGRSVVRYRHVLDEAWGLEPRARALLAVLLLRGPQTVGELRIRTERMAPMDRLDDVEAELRALAKRSEPLVVRMSRQPGQKEERYSDLVGPPRHRSGSHPSPDESDSGHDRLAAVPAGAGAAHRAMAGEAPRVSGWEQLAGDGPGGYGSSHSSSGPTGQFAPGEHLSAGTGTPAASSDVEVLRAEIAEIRSAVALLRQDLDELRTSLGG